MANNASTDAVKRRQTGRMFGKWIWKQFADPSGSLLLQWIKITLRQNRTAKVKLPTTPANAAIDTARRLTLSPQSCRFAPPNRLLIEGKRSLPATRHQ